MAYISGLGYKIEIESSTTPDTFVNLCATSASVAMTESVDSFAVLCGSGMTNNIVTRIDPTWTITCKLDSESEAVQMLQSMQLSINRIKPVKITDIAKKTENVWTFNGTFTDISISYTTDAVVEVSFTLKVADGKITVA